MKVLRLTTHFPKREQRGKSKEGRRKQQRTEEGEAYRPQPRAYQGKGEHQLPNSAHRACRDKLEPKGGKRENGEAYNPQPPWCNFCWKTGHTAQACWWNTNAQHQKHQKKKAWRSPRRNKQLQRDNGGQSFADWLASNKSLMSSFKKQSQDKSLAMLENLDNSLAAEPWALLVDTGAATSVAPKSLAQHLELSPAPSTFQLATATGEAIKIFGLRHVHLQCQDLSFKVSFVIADVVTPILGLETIMQHNTAGKRTQLEHVGKHLYLVACPCQHGLSTCFIGNLSDVIGFLPEDKEIHEQEVALRSSSSPDLVEDQKQEQDEQDSLNFQCHSVLHTSCHEHVKNIFVGVLCDDEVAVSGGELSDNSLHPVQQPKKLSSQDEQLHNKTPRSTQLRSEEPEEAKDQKLEHVLSSACVYDLPDMAWHDPACVFRSRLSQSQLSKNSGQLMTHKLAARKGARCSKTQGVTGAELSL